MSAFDPTTATLAPVQFDPASASPTPPAPSFDPSTAVPQEDHVRRLTADPAFDPVSYYAENPSADNLTVAREAFKAKAAPPTDYGKAAGEFIAGAIPSIGTGIAGMVKGVGHAVANVGTEISPFASKDDQERAQRENASALQLGALQSGETARGIGRNIQRLFGKTDRTLSDQEIEDQIQHEAAHRAVVQSLTQGNVVEGGIGEPLGFGAVERQNKTPDQLAAAGTPVSPENIESESFLGDPSTYAIAPVAEFAGPIIGKTITGPALKAAGATVGAAGKATSAVLGHSRGLFGGLAYSLYTHDPIGAIAGYSAEAAAKNLIPPIATALNEAGAEAAGQAFPPVGQGLVKKAFKAGATGAVTGGVLSAPFVAAAQTPREAGQAFGGGVGIGGALGAFGGVQGSRATDIAAKFWQLSKEGSAMNYGLGWDDANAKWSAQLSPDQQNIINAYRARYNGKTDANGIPIQIYTVGGSDYARALQENGGGTATDTRGFISPDGTKIFLNADAAGGAGKTNETLGHEAGGHLTEFLSDISQSHDISQLRNSLHQVLYDQNGQPTPEFASFMRNYSASLARNGASPEDIAKLDPAYFEKEIIAQHAAKILTGENIANFNLPKPITEKLIQGASNWLQSQGIVSKRGEGVGWGANEIKRITGQMRDLLYKQGAQSEAARADRANGNDQSPSVNYRVKQLETILANPPTRTSTVDKAKAYQAAQREYDNLTGASPTPAAQPGSTPYTDNAAALDKARQDARAALSKLGYKASQINQWIADANTQHGSPIEDPANLIKAALRLSRGGTVPAGEFLPKPAAPAAPISAPTGAAATFRDELGNTHTVTGIAPGAPNIGDIVVTREGEIRRVTRALGETVDTARPIDPLNARGTKTHKVEDVAKLTHDYAPAQPQPSTPGAATPAQPVSGQPQTPQETPPTITVKPSAGGRFQIVDAAGNPVSKVTYGSEADARQSIARRGKPSTFGLPPSTNGNDIIDAILEEGGIHFGKMLKEEIENQFPHKGIWRSAISTANGNLTPDEVARLVQDRGFGDGTPGTMFAEISKAIEGRSRLRDQQEAESKRQKAEAKNAPNEPSTPSAPNEPLPTEHGSTVASPPSSAETPAPVPLSPSPDVGDYQRIAAQEREAFLSDKAPAKAGKNKGQHTQDNLKKADKSAFDAAADAHAATVPLNYEGMRLRTDGFGKRTMSGTVDPSRPFDAWLIQRAQQSGHLPGEAFSALLALQNAIGRTVSYDYGHAPVLEEGDMPTHTGRATQQAEHTVAKRLSGESPMQTERKTSVPLRVGFNAGTNSFTVYGVSQEKLLNNFNHLAEKMADLGIALPFRDINDPRFVAAFKNVIANHENGWKGDGSTQAVPTQDFPFTPNPEWAQAPEHQLVPKEQFEFINALLGDEGMKSASPEAKAKAHLANENDIAYDPRGEVNELRYRINQTTPEVEGKTWSKATIEDPLNENISPALTSNIGPASQSDESIRVHGKVGDLGRLFDKGKTPNRAFTSAGFMPDTAGAEDRPESVKKRAEKLWAEKGTASPFFKKWFGGSNIVDEDGKPIRVFHGTNDTFTEFEHAMPNRKDTGWIGRGFYFTDNPKLASDYTALKPGENSQVIPAFLKIENPYKASWGEKQRIMLAERQGDTDAAERRTRQLINEGYDGIILPYGKEMGGSTEYVAFKPEQIKIATGNQGTFDAANSDMRFMPDERRDYTADDAHRIIGDAEYLHGTGGGADDRISDLANQAEEVGKWRDIHPKNAAQQKAADRMQRRETDALRELEMLVTARQQATQKVGITDNLGEPTKGWVHDENGQPVYKEFPNTRAWVEEARRTNPANPDQGRFMPYEDRDPFYSQLTRTIKSLPQDTMTVGQAKAAITKGAKPDEVKQQGILEDPLSPLVGKSDTDKVRKKELADYSIERAAKVQDVVSEPKFQKPTLVFPGDYEGYREMFVTWPSGGGPDKIDTSKWTARTDTPPPSDYNPHPKPIIRVFDQNGVIQARFENFEAKDEADAIRKTAQDMAKHAHGNWNDSHPQYANIQNPIVRIRRNIRTDSEGNRVYFIEELQGPNAENQEKMPPEVRKRIYEIGMKRALRDAVDEGADKIAWTTGEQQASRYDLSKQIDSVTVKQAPSRPRMEKPGMILLVANESDGSEALHEVIPEEKLSDYIGKEAAQKISSQAPDSNGARHLNNADLKVGGEGLKRLYDSTLPRIANDLAKKFGVKSEKTEIVTQKESNPDFKAVQNDAGNWLVQGNYGTWISDPVRMTSTYNRGQAANLTREQANKIVSAKSKSETIHSLEIPEALKTQQRGGNALFMPDTGTPEEGATPGERLAREAESAGVVLNVATLKGLIQQDEDTMNRVRARIQQNTGKPARFMPTGPTEQPPESTEVESAPLSGGIARAQKQALTSSEFLANLRNANRDATTDPQDARRSISASILRDDEAGEGAQGEAGREAQKKAVVEWARNNGLLLDKLPSFFDSKSQHNVGGVEHDVWADAKSQRFVKATKPSFGVFPDILVRLEYDPSLPGPTKWQRKTDWTLSKSTPLQYLEKLDGLKKFSGIDTRIEGVMIDAKGNPSFVTSQPEIQGRDISDSDVERHMKESGFLKIDDNTASYYRPSDNFAALDAHAGNIVERDGKLVAFDGVFIHPKGELKSIIEQQYEAAKQRAPSPSTSGSFLDADRSVMKKPNVRELAKQRILARAA